MNKFRYIACSLVVFGTMSAGAPAAKADLDWGQLVRKGVLAGISAIPEAGRVIAAVVGALWPEGTDSNKNAFQAIEADVQKLVDERILQAQIGNMTDQVDGFAKIADEYAQLSGNTMDRCSKLSGLVQEGIAIYNNLTNLTGTNASDKPHYIPILATFMPLHLGVLREQFLHAAEICQDDNPRNQKAWENELIYYHGKYISDLNALSKKLEKWRHDSVFLVETGRSYNWIEFYIYDSVMNTTFGSAIQMSIAETPHLILKDMQDYAVTSWAIDMLPVWGAFYQIDGFLVGTSAETETPYDCIQHAEIGDRINLGPIYPMTFDPAGKVRYLSKPPDFTRDVGGTITSVDIHHGDTVDGMRFYYDGSPGTLVATAGGSLDTITMDGRSIAHIATYWRPFGEQLRAVRFTLDDGSTFGPYGNGSGDQKILIPESFDTPASYALVGVQMSEYTVSNRGIGALVLSYDYVNTPTLCPAPEPASKQ